MPPKRARRSVRRTPARAATSIQRAQNNTTETVGASGGEAGSEPDLPSDPLSATLTATASHFTTPRQITTEASTSSEDVQAVSHTQTANATSDIDQANVTATQSTSRGRRLLSQPKHAGRRNHARLQELQKADDDRRKAETAAKVTAESTKAKRDGRSVAKRGRARGGYVGGKAQRDVASGPFGAAQASDYGKRRGSWQSGSRSQTRSTTTQPASKRAASKIAEDGKAVKQESSIGQSGILDYEGDVTMLDRLRYSAENGGYVSSDDEEDGQAVDRLNVESLGIIDLTKDETDFDNFAPIRVTRFAHKERSFGINADGATNEDGMITVDANDTAAVSSADRKGKHKARDADVLEERQVFQGTYSDSESDLESAPRVGRGTAVKPAADRADTVKEAPSSPDLQRRAKGKIKARIDENDYHTRDELEEWERHQEDLEVLRNVLGESANVSTTTEDKRADKVFIFQFPPTLPELQSSVVKPEESVTASVNPPTEPHDDPASETQKAQSFPTGFVGKLRVHASGRVSLDWGGADLSLSMGSNASFLQDVVIASLPEPKEDGGDAMQTDLGVAMSMGQVKGKFVITPNWDEMF